MWKRSTAVTLGLEELAGILAVFMVSLHATFSGGGFACWC